MDISYLLHLFLFFLNLTSFLPLANARALQPKANVTWHGPRVDGFPGEILLHIPLEEKVTLTLGRKEGACGSGVKVVVEQLNDTLDDDSLDDKCSSFVGEGGSSIFKVYISTEGTEYFGEFSWKGKEYLLIANVAPASNQSLVSSFLIDGVQHIVTQFTYEDREDVLQTRMSMEKDANATRSIQKQDLTVEALAVVDYYLYINWLSYNNGDARKTIRNMLHYYQSIYEKVNSIYRTINNDYFSLSITLSGIIIITEKSQSSIYENYDIETVYEKDLLVEFTHWIEREKEIKNNTFPNYDIATFFTRQENGQMGRAFLGRTCMTYSCNTVVDKALISSVTLVAHEIGHSLGAQHDDESMNGCSYDDGFLMASYHDSEALNKGRFSSCSVSYFLGYFQWLDGEGINCLLTEAPQEAGTTPAINPDAALDRQCQILLGDEAVYCLEFVSPKIDCSQLFCKQANSTTCDYLTDHQVFDGTPCASSGHCRDGLCVSNESLPIIVEDCAGKLTRDEQLPKEVLLVFELKGVGRVKLNLKETSSLNDDSVVVATSSEDHWHSDQKQNIAIYEDVNNGATFSVSSGKHGHKYFGSFLFKNKTYSLKPAGEDIVKGHRRKFKVRMEKVNYSISETKDETKFERKASIQSMKNERKNKRGKNKNKNKNVKRSKRAIVTERQGIIIEVLVVVDYSVYKSWMTYNIDDKQKTIASILQYYSHVVAGVDAIYKKIVSSEYLFSVRMSGIYITETAEDSFTEHPDIRDGDYISYLVALEKLFIWISDRGSKIPKHDAVLSFTKFEAYGDLGLAFLDTPCSNWDLSISIDNGVYSTLDTAAHELAHILGSEHDGDGNECQPSDQYLMTPVQDSSSIINHHTFSPCSVKYMADTLEHLGSENCLLNTTVGDSIDISENKDVILGTSYPMDEQCRQMLDRDSHFCSRGLYSDEGKCTKMACFKAETGKCVVPVGSRALDGSACGTKKWCMNSTCVYDVNAPTAKEKCIDGDFFGKITYNGVPSSCTDLAKVDGACNNDKIIQLCCETCARIRSENIDCPNGDKYSNCNEFLSDCRFEGMRQDCCQTCDTFIKSNPSDCQYGNYLANCDDLKPFCDEEDVKEKCCMTC